MGRRIMGSRMGRRRRRGTKGQSSEAIEPSEAVEPNKVISPIRKQTKKTQQVAQFISVGNLSPCSSLARSDDDDRSVSSPGAPSTVPRSFIRKTATAVSTPLS